MIEAHHKRIAGMHVTKTGDIALVWMAVNPDTQNIHIYDSALFHIEVPAVIAESMNNRGRWIPVAWANQEMMRQFQERGVRMLPDPSSITSEMAEVVSRELWERIRGKRITVDKNLKGWAEEAKSLSREKGLIPNDSHPLMAATRIAMQQIKFARRQGPRNRGPGKKQRQVAIV